MVAAYSVNHEVNALGSGTDTVAYYKDILAHNYYVASFHNHGRIPVPLLVCIDYLAFQDVAMTIYRIHYQRFTHPDLIGHPADEGLVTDSNGRIPCEIEVIQGIEGVIFIPEICSQCISPGRKSFYQHLGELN